MNKSERHFAIKDIVLTHTIANQEELCLELKKRGFIVTQATLSRDLKELGVVRGHSDQGSRYVLSTESEERRLKSLVGVEVLSIESNEAMIVIRTLPGRAPGVASFIDSLHDPHILGTVAGDDTVLVTPSSVRKTVPTMKLIKQLMHAHSPSSFTHYKETKH